MHRAPFNAPHIRALYTVYVRAVISVETESRFYLLVSLSFSFSLCFSFTFLRASSSNAVVLQSEGREKGGGEEGGTPVTRKRRKPTGTRVGIIVARGLSRIFKETGHAGYILPSSLFFYGRGNNKPRNALRHVN